MSALTTLFALLLYFAAAVMTAGLAYKVYQYAKTPAPLKVPITPAPLNATGAGLRVAREVLLFKSLFKSNKWIWLFGAIFHVALALVLLRHLRDFIQPDWTWVVHLKPFDKYAGYALVFGLVGLWARRLFQARVRYISHASDHLILLLLAAIAASGLAIRYVERVDLMALKAFALGLLYFDWQPLPGDPLLLIHLALVAALMIVFPFSKLLHVPGVFFSPSRNQADNPRERRHLAPWAARLDNDKDA